MKFSDITGFDELKAKLLDMVRNNHVPHALLINGKEGSPVLPFALAFSTLVNCENFNGGADACGECSSCKKNEKYIHPDLNFIFPASSTKDVRTKDVSSRTFLKDWRKFLLEKPFGTVEDWADMFGGENKQLFINRNESRVIISTLGLKAFEGKYKIMLVWLPELMHPGGANAILKILEEPTDNTLFLLVSQDRERLLGTIISRTQSIFVRAFDPEEITSILMTDHGISDSDANRIARMSEGNLNVAISMCSSTENDFTSEFVSWMRECFSLKVKELVARSESFHKMNKVVQRGFLKYALGALRESIVYKFTMGKANRMTESEKGFIHDFSTVVNSDNVEIISTFINDAYYYLDRNGSAKIVFMELSLKIAKALKS